MADEGSIGIVCGGHHTASPQIFVAIVAGDQVTSRRVFGLSVSSIPSSSDHLYGIGSKSDLFVGNLFDFVVLFRRDSILFGFDT
jgi:hypothetical protein